MDVLYFGISRKIAAECEVLKKLQDKSPATLNRELEIALETILRASCV